MKFVTVSEWNDSRQCYITFNADICHVDTCEYRYIYYSAKLPEPGVPGKHYQFELRTYDYKILNNHLIIVFSREDNELVQFSK